MAMGMALSSIAFSCVLIAHALHHYHYAGYQPAEWNSGETNTDLHTVASALFDRFCHKAVT
jgi:hypothetical protein